jgi:hypothetical protein
MRWVIVSSARAVVEFAQRQHPIVWAVPAVINVAIGVALLRDSDRWYDFATVMRWSASWLTADRLWTTTAWFSDYPPHAIVFLSPLSRLTPLPAVVLWAAINIGLAVVAPTLAARFVNPRARPRQVMLLTVLFLCWGSARTLMQFTLLTLVCGLASMVLAGKRPMASGLCLALSVMKPQVAAPFALWILMAGHWRVLGTAAAAVAGGWITYAAVARVRLQDVALQYATVLRHYYTGAEPMRGVADLRPVILRLVPAHASDIVSLLVALALLAFVIAATRWALDAAAAHGRDRWSLAFVPALAGAWSLLTFYHLTYGFVLLLPASAVLLLLDHPRTAGPRQVFFWLLQAGLIVDLPTVWRRIGHAFPRTLDPVVADIDRVLVLAVFAGLLVLCRLTTTPVRRPRL